MEVEESEEYLCRHQERLKVKSVPATTDVRRGDPADEIVEDSVSLEVDLVVLGTHGTVGAEAFWTGSVAAKVARKTVTPVLLVPVKPDKNKDQ